MSEPSPEMERLGQAIRARRESKNWTVYRLAKKASVSPPYLTEIEEGRSKRAGVQVVARLAHALEVTTDQLLVDAELMEAPPGERFPPLHVFLGLSEMLNHEDVMAVSYIVRRLRVASEYERRLAETRAPYEAAEEPDISNLAAHPADEEAHEERRFAEGWTDEDTP